MMKYIFSRQMFFSSGFSLVALSVSDTIGGGCKTSDNRS